MSRLRAQDGIGLVELVMAMTLSVVVLGATMSVFDGMWGRQRAVEQHGEAQDGARKATAVLARHLRNLSSATGYGTASHRPEAVELAQPYELVFKAAAERTPGPIAGNETRLERVRYCLDASGTLRMLTQSATAFTPAPPATGACAATPPAGWSTSRVVVAQVSNRANGANRALFRYGTDASWLPYGDPAALDDITRVQTDIAVDPDPARRPVESRLVTSLFLRNQNRAPSASFTATVENPVARTVLLDGSASADPEAADLSYEWLDGATVVGRGVTLRLTAATGGVHRYSLRVTDPAGLGSVAPAQEVTFP